MNARRPHFRLVDRYELFEGSARLGERVAELVPVEAEYVVLDLDRTVHLGVTIGEQLGWEIAADPELTWNLDLPFDAGALVPAGPLPPIWSWRFPRRSISNVARATVRWMPAGLLYTATVRAGGRWPRWHRTLTVGLGIGYVERMQSLMRSILMSTSAGYSTSAMRRFAARAWHRWRRTLVVDAESITAIRAHCPRLKAIVMSSASTHATVQHAAEILGVDDFVSSAVDRVRVNGEDLLAAPPGLPRWAGAGRPRYFSRPGAVVHNSAERKIGLLRARHPSMFAPGAVTVGISDNNHNEDGSWPDYFSHVVALNSRFPFPPLVRSGSPCISVKVADAVPADPAARFGGPEWLGGLKAAALDAAELGRRAAQLDLARLEHLLDALRAARERAHTQVDESMRRASAQLVSRLGDAVERYNRAVPAHRRTIARELAELGARLRRTRARLSRIGRESARIQFEIDLMCRRAADLIVLRRG